MSERSYESSLVGSDNESDQDESKKSSYDVSVPSAPAPQLEGSSSPPKPVVNQPKLNLDALNKQREDVESERLSPHDQPSDRPTDQPTDQPTHPPTDDQRGLRSRNQKSTYSESTGTPVEFTMRYE